MGRLVAMPRKPIPDEQKAKKRSFTLNDVDFARAQEAARLAAKRMRLNISLAAWIGMVVNEAADAEFRREFQPPAKSGRR